MFSFSPFGGSVTTLRHFWRMPRGKASVGSVVIHNRKSVCGFVVCSRIFSRVLSHDARRWQLRSMIHCPRAAPVSSICCAALPCPWPSAMNLSFGPPKPSLSASEKTSYAGSAPGESTNSTGVSGALCSYTLAKLSTGGWTYLSPIFEMMNVCAPTVTRSGRKHRRRQICWRLSSLSEYPRGNGTDSGASRSYHASHTLPLSRMSSIIESNSTQSVTSRFRSCHPASVIHLKGGSDAMTSERFPLMKKENRSRLISSACMRIMEVIWNEKSSLCFSNSPVHV
mmetsp:Transcript_36345/g.86019  ORF Transcript_36345/g.86019 Transcript_36345/m.86019 type:complete len:282 (-) Transcript_36345:11152-11997(-)